MARNKNKEKQHVLLPKQFNPLTPNQEKFLDAYDDHHIVAIGSPGTGKTYVALHLACISVFEEMTHRKIVIYRSAVPSRDLGFMPGNEDEKIAVYESPYIQNFSKIFGRDDAYGILKKKMLVLFESTSFCRGITLDNAIVIVDEAQNMSGMELHTLTTRIGKNTKLILCGDLDQCDLKHNSDLKNFLTITSLMTSFRRIEFTIDDIVRSDFLKEYLIARQKFLKQGIEK